MNDSKGFLYALKKLGGKEMFKKRSVISFILILLMIFTTGCGQPEEQTTKKSDENNDYSVTVTDGLGKEVTFTEEPKEIISVIPSSTEIIYALGEGDRIVGVSDYDNYPEEVTEKTKYGSMDLNIEGMLAANPDMIILSATQATKYESFKPQFEEAGIEIFVSDDNATTFEGTYESIKTHGEVLQVKDKADEIVTSMKDAVDEISQKADDLDVESPKVWVEISPSPEIYTAGKGTFIDEMLTMINAENVAKDVDGWAKMSDELVVAANPDVIITTYGSYSEDPVKQVATRPGWENTNAVKNGQVYDLNNDTLSRPGPRLVDGLNDLFAAVYPDAK